MRAWFVSMKGRMLSIIAGIFELLFVVGFGDDSKFAVLDCGLVQSAVPASVPDTNPKVTKAGQGAVAGFAFLHG